MSDDRLEHLETKLAFLEDANRSLSDELYRQGLELDRLRARLADLASRLDAAPGAAPASPADERPPHY